MSEPVPTAPETRDRGMTLPELLIAIVLLGVVSAVLAAGVSVTLRQQQSTKGRIDVAHWEQNLGMWLPDDLTSASSVDIKPATAPCPSADCTAGSNVIQLSWTNGTSTTTVSYRYQPDRNGSFGIYRVECVDGRCNSRRVLGDLSAPIDDLGRAIPNWKPGDAVPANIVKVDAPDSLNPAAPASQRQVSVTVNGRPADDGIVRSSRVTIAAGGTELGTLAAPTFTAPTFDTAYSECGGPITLIVDRSGSIGNDMGSVRTAVKAFVDAFDGTPTQMQIISFSDTSSTLGATGTQWNRYYDLSNPGTATTLKSLVDGLRSSGATNWEDAIFRALNTRTGTSLELANDSTAPMPEMVVLFTDGLPTTDRQAQRSDSAPTTMTIDPMYTGTGNTLSPRAWWRADIVRGSSPRFIAVGVGPSFSGSTAVPTWTRGAIQHQEFLGELVSTGLPSNTTDSTYKAVSYNTTTRSWPDVSKADLLISSDFTKAAAALQQIALATCGGTVTVQTRLQDGSSAQFDLQYEMETKQATTSRFNKTAVFDVAVAGQTTRTVRIVPRAEQIAQAGFRARTWTCKAAGVNFNNFSLVNSSDPSQGINLTVKVNEAVACTLEVRP